MGDTTSDSVKLDFTKRALREIATCKRNWLKRRDKNPALFEAELAKVLESIQIIPAFGSPTNMMSRGKIVRRVEMLKTKHQVFYRQDSDELVYIMSVWGGKRGQQPKLR